MPWAAAAAVAGAVIAGESAKSSAKKSAAAQQAGIDTATGEQRRQFDITSEQLRTADLVNRQQVERGRRSAINALTIGGKAQRRQLSPFAQAGAGALEQQQALLGLGTPEQQQQAFAAFNESPGQKFMRGRAQKNLLRNQAAIGGIGGGNVRSALVEQGAGFAAQDFSNQFNRLGQLASGGQAAATNIGQGALSTASNIGQTQFQAGQLIGSGAINTAARQGQFGQQSAQNIGNLAVAGGQAQAQGIQNQSNINQNVIGQLANTAGQFINRAPPPSTVRRS